jgi:hypothetical protein
MMAISVRLLHLGWTKLPVKGPYRYLEVLNVFEVSLNGKGQT